jgi:prolyl-tRNA editing enzyme YbaK/EbsC (Cys-tRNA(Pro) deacylase)
MIVGPGTLSWASALDAARAADEALLPAPVRTALIEWAERDETAAAAVLVAPIDPDLADTAQFCAAYDVSLDESVNCVVVAGRRGEVTRYAACLVQATRRADVNGVARRQLEARKASFAPMDETVRLTGMQFGGITPIGVPGGWPILVDAAAASLPGLAIVGSGLRGSKIALPASLLADLPGATVLELAQP